MDLQSTINKGVQNQRIGLAQILFGYQGYTVEEIDFSISEEICDLLKAIKMLGYKSATIPTDPNHRLKDDQDGRLIDAGRYQHLVRRLIYLFLDRLDDA